jgi:hypothetical protein
MPGTALIVVWAVLCFLLRSRTVHAERARAARAILAAVCGILLRGGDKREKQAAKWNAKTIFSAYPAVLDRCIVGVFEIKFKLAVCIRLARDTKQKQRHYQVPWYSFW